MASRKKLPRRFVQFTKDYPRTAAAYEALGRAVHGEGILSTRERALIKFALSVGARLEGGAHAHVRKALEAGIEVDKLRHVALLAIPTIGFPASMAAMSWVEDVVGGRKKRR
ncbi:MAG: carboxymuconolactone decarboxylase [Ignavibacteria bacterium GWA2_55_11]|nr:MAG: carboxymuconolactone decarboxylase [Ignavibacteria bacterium GWA2_55_11]OGU45022.1 MAG: carboxymuconolactone decarboxylase [Ignavibacteria bacterium GWC2_56_12]OGU63640.1 MAG: carboxymuconolactone decarboxylase [Ignavibacteria bacterium RIFCSPHIGHO2_02_FULL_56_12]OGU74964.1 MAG: carboxymuconolactone decarboxylase [Ignavibacteria bacterium RIFCSPLOWO2_02_FULL_55_14]OGU76039.1 MAG: carboxymuconolactone decarboxylase [Ignavibacteria bacterium RIFCSPLOWO2_12_FULL_56_21]HAV23734.1 carboxymu